MRKTVMFALTLALGLGASTTWADGATNTKAAAKSNAAEQSAATTSTPAAVMKELQSESGKDKRERKLSPKQLAKIAQQQLEKLTAYAMKQVRPELEKKGTFEPIGAMVYRDGKINQVVIKSDKVPAVDKIRMYRVALRSLARHNKIDASVVIFSAQLKKNSQAKAIIMNYEHRFGVSGTRVIGYKFNKGKLELTKPKDMAKPFFVFYDQNRVNNTPRTVGSKLQ